MPPATAGKDDEEDRDPPRAACPGDCWLRRPAHTGVTPVRATWVMTAGCGSLERMDPALIL